MELGTVKRPATEAASEDSDLVLDLEAPASLPAFDLGIDAGPPPDTPETRLDHWKRKLLASYVAPRLNP